MMRRKPPQPFGAIMGDRALTLNVEDEVLARFEALARDTGRSSEQLAEEALKRYVEYESWKADKIRDAVRRADAGDFATDDEMEAVFDRYRAADTSG
jgi:predicted transcriptional regulator